MKKSQHWNQLILGTFALLMIGFYSGCAASGTATSNTADAGAAGNSGKKGRKAKKEEVYNPAGVWQYEVDSSQGSGGGIMRITGEPGNFEVILETDQFGELRVYDLEMTGETMSGKIDVGGQVAEVEGDFDGDEFSGAIIVGDNVLPMEAARTSK